MRVFGWLDRPTLAPDDRGRMVALIGNRDLKRADDGGDSPRAKLAAHLRAAVAAEARRFSLRSFGRSILLVAGWLGLMAFVEMTTVSRVPFAGTVVFWGGLGVVVVLARGDTRRRMAKQLAATAAAEGVCGSCAYSLRDLVAEADGCLVCPECGSAWKAGRITRPHWQAARASHQPPWWLLWITGTPSMAQRMAPDDRGGLVPMVDSRLLAAPPENRQAMGPTRVREMRRRLRRIGRVWRGVVALPLVGLTGLCIWGIVVSMDDDEARLVLVLLGSIGGVFAVAALAVFMGHGFIHPRRVADEVWRRGLCASCLEPLGCESVEGRITCPRCGAGWLARDRSQDGGT